MKASYIEGVANHDVPESCRAAREGGVEAFDRGMYGLGIEPRNHLRSGADAVMESGRQHRLHRQREMQTDPARSEAPCTCRISLRENREICWLVGTMVCRDAWGRP